MKTFLTEDFLLHSPAARELYHGFAKNEPLFDYHCHISPRQIADNHRFKNLQEIWLAGDHYKWRAMRANGVAERFITGDAPDEEKFLAYAKTVPFTIRNPLYHWTHLELLRFFDIDDLLDEKTAPAIWEKANALLSQPDFHAQRLVEKSRVTVICTTDDPADDLTDHRRIREDGQLLTRVYPAFRPDNALRVNQPDAFNAWLEKLSASADTDCATLAGLLSALEKRHTYFHEQGSRLSDHGLAVCPGQFASETEAARIFDAARSGVAANSEEWERFAGFLMLFFGRLDARRGWTKQLHLGALRSTNTRRLQELGPDTGFDSIGDWPQAASLVRYLDALESEHSLPKTILYNLNPADNYMLATMAGNFQDGSIPGKIQFGSGWWFLDQKEVEHGELPRDIEFLGGIVRRICFGNAAEYFGLEQGRLD